MFDTRKFGAYISKLRKKADMTQSELADKLNLTRQAISKYEIGDSFPEISILVLIAGIFNISIDDLIKSGDPSIGEALILNEIANGKDDFMANDVNDVVNLAPLLKPSILTKLANDLGNQGIDISNIVTLAEYLSDDSVKELLTNATFDTISEELLEKLIPLLDNKSKSVIFEKILTGVLDWHMLKILIPYADNIESLIEAAVVEGALPLEALAVMHEGLVRKYQNSLK